MTKIRCFIICGKLFPLNRCNRVGLSNRSSILLFPFSVGEYSCVADDFKARLPPTRSDFKSLQQ